MFVDRMKADWLYSSEGGISVVTILLFEGQSLYSLPLMDLPSSISEHFCCSTLQYRATAHAWEIRSAALGDDRARFAPGELFRQI